MYTKKQGEKYLQITQCHIITLATDQINDPLRKHKVIYSSGFNTCEQILY